MENSIVYGIVVATFVIFLLIIGIALMVALARKAHISNELKVSKVELAALRSQMNPHFIFNCLRSIAILTEQNNTKEASVYLGKFSRLMRNMLEQSREEESILAKEIETLQLYIEMESLRIKDKMFWDIKVDEELEIDFIKIPSLLIQPYVENAIWHGIMHLEGQGKLTVNFRQHAKTQDLIIEVIDNGIGREKSSLLNANQINKPKSLGTKINQERIELLNLKENFNAQVEMFDLIDDNNIVTGTKVSIQFSSIN